MKRIFLYIILVFSACQLKAQTNSGSPYSNYGFGLFPENIGPYSGMGGVGVAMRDNVNLNFLNPASYTALDSNRFYFQFAMNGEYVHLSTYKQKSNYQTGQNSSLTMGFRLARNLYMSLGFLEKSDVGYDVTYTEFISGDENSNLFSQDISGEGGINEVFLGLGWKYKNLSLGVNAGYDFGKVERRQTLISSVQSGYYIKTSDRSQITGFLFTPGIQYQFMLPKQSILTVGATMNFKTRLNGDRQYTAQEINETTSTSNMLADEKIDDGTIIYPSKYTIGLDYHRNNKWHFSTDYTYQKMSDYKAYDKESGFNDYHKGAIGISYLPNEMGRKWGQRNEYMLGAYAIKSNLELKGVDINTYALTVGTRMPFRFHNRELNLGVAMDFGMRGSEENGLIKEKFVKLRINLALKEGWFMKRKIN